MSYATLAEFHAFANLVSVTDDASIQKLLDAADRMINRFCNRPLGFLAAADTRYYSGKGLPYIVVEEFVSATTVSVKDSASDTAYTDWTTPTTYYAGDGDWLPFAGDPASPTFGRTPYTGLMVDPNGDYSVFTDGTYRGLRGFRPDAGVPFGVPTVRVLGSFGYATTVPGDIKTACAMQALRWYKRLQSAMSTNLASSDLGQIEIYSRLDPDIGVILRDGRYMRPSLI